jgi:Serine/threonine protein kinase
MSPEEASAEQNLDGRSDIFSLGCVLYEMLIGEAPFGGPTAQIGIARPSEGQRINGDYGTQRRH